MKMKKARFLKSKTIKITWKEWFKLLFVPSTIEVLGDFPAHEFRIKTKYMDGKLYILESGYYLK
jgi:hypothetical protein